MRQELTYGEFSLIISAVYDDEMAKPVLNFELGVNGLYQCSILILTPIKNTEQLQDEFDKVIVHLGIEFCRADKLKQCYDYFAPHIKEILSNYCIRVNSDEDIKDVNLRYIRSKFVEENT